MFLRNGASYRFPGFAFQTLAILEAMSGTRRRIGDIIIAGCGNDAGKDTTYVTPIERLLIDIRRRGDHVELPLSREELHGVGGVGEQA